MTPLERLTEWYNGTFYEFDGINETNNSSTV